MVGGHCEGLVMPYGLINALPGFQSIINDIPNYFVTLDEHIEHVCIVLRCFMSVKQFLFLLLPQNIYIYAYAQRW